MTDIMLAYPDRLWGLVLVVVFLLYQLVAYRRRPTIFFSGFAQARSLGNFAWGRWLHYFKTLLAVCILTFIVVLLARPQSAKMDSEITVEGIDLFFALDVSESMLAEDLTPNRLEAAKSYIHDFLAQMQGDRAGIIIFSGKPFVQAPLTFDYEVLQAYVSEISVQSINQRMSLLGGTAVGDSILEAKRRLPKSEDGTRTRVLVIVTDGDSNVGLDPIIGARLARQEGIKVYTIGVGKKEGAKIPIGIKNGRKVYAINDKGEFVMTKFNEETLQQMAEIARGKYFYAKDNQALEQSLKAIASLEKGTIKIEDKVVYRERAWPFLVALLGLGSVYVLLDTLKPLRV